jgi:hypothetical protein
MYKYICANFKTNVADKYLFTIIYFQRAIGAWTQVCTHT